MSGVFAFADDVVALARKQAERDAATLDLLATAFDAVAIDLECAGVRASHTRDAAARLHGLALEFTVGSPT